MRLLASILVLFLFTGCTFFKSAGCDASKAVSSIVASTISTQLTCKNLDAVKSSIDAEIAKTKICDAAPAAKSLVAQSAVGDIICAPVIDVLAGGVLKQIPEAWGCSGGPLTDGFKAQLVAACLKAL